MLPAAPDIRFQSDVCLRLVAPNFRGYALRESAQCPIFAVAGFKAVAQSPCRFWEPPCPTVREVNRTDNDMRAPPVPTPISTIPAPVTVSGGRPVVPEQHRSATSMWVEGVFTNNDSATAGTRIGAGVYYFRNCDIVDLGHVFNAPLMCLRAARPIRLGRGRQSPVMLRGAHFLRYGHNVEFFSIAERRNVQWCPDGLREQQLLEAFRVRNGFPPHAQQHVPGAEARPFGR